MARKRHHASRRHGHHLSHAESERMLHDKEMKHHRTMHHQSKLSRYHEHAGEERHLHGYHEIPPHKYDTLRHERDMFNDEFRHDAMPESSGPYPYDRQGMEEHRIRERSSGRITMYRDGHYEGYNDRRKQELRDAGMIHEDHRQIANLPQEVRMEPYPMTGPYTPEDLDDTLRGVDRQMNFDNEQKMRHFFPKKF